MRVILDTGGLLSIGKTSAIAARTAMAVRRDDETDMTGGKADRFPLRDEAKRCWTPADLLSEEQPVLLDPTVRTDPGLLWFDEDGSARP